MQETKGTFLFTNVMIVIPKVLVDVGMISFALAGRMLLRARLIDYTLLLE